MKKEIVGIDVSKAKLDVWLHRKQLHKTFPNNGNGFKKLLSWLIKLNNCNEEDLAFCFEHSGLYSLPLCEFFTRGKFCYYQVSGLMVKRSLGLVRGKNDKVDAKNLARFAVLHQAELQPYELPEKNILRLKQLLSFRDKLVRQCAGYKTYNRGLEWMQDKENSDFQRSISLELIAQLNKKIKNVELEIIGLIESDESLNKTYQLLTSIKGVGLIVAASVITSTNNFKAFKVWRKFACYAGIAPFEHQSGSSYRGRTRISSLGNRTIKKLLSQAAATAIQYNEEMRIYYQRRLSEGKSKMSTLNIIRNKIVSRMFATVARQTPYVNVCKFAA